MGSTNHVGKIIKQKRLEKGLTLRKLGLLTNISHQYLNLLERGFDYRSGKPVSPTLDILKRLSQGLDIPMDEFIDDEIISPGHSPGAFKLNRKYICMVPVVSRVSAGDPKELKKPTDELWPVDLRLLKIYNIDLNSESSMYFMEVEGDSMQPIFNDGDYILVSNAEVKSGNIAVVSFNGCDSCLRRVQFKENDLVVLLSRNPKYDPIVIPRDECELKGRVLLRVGEPRWW